MIATYPAKISGSARITQVRRDHHPDEQEREGGQDEGRATPHVVEPGHGLTGQDVVLPRPPQDDPGRHGGDNSRPAETRRHEEGAVCRDHREQRLEAAVRDCGHHLDRQVAPDQAHSCPEQHDPGEQERAARESHGLGERRQGDGEQHDARAVVEQGLGVDDRGEPDWGVQTFE